MHTKKKQKKNNALKTYFYICIYLFNFREKHGHVFHQDHPYV